ncbi:leucine-rich repeat and coiled-coil domain-containing protein 1 [Gambusia affinis]|uniref:leucine-rich repeat and coiled-coil domain-containing protein 1 n=1 Tax=Gambusia affinis TaxID=33528 RepID=UPI001CDC852D|nr:leucine-rich repeat and coiled-coil domain-containing protein 1 [Gambusia affinis]
MGDKELSLIDKQLTSLKDVPLSPDVTSLNLHCNHIPRIEGLSSAWHLHHLDLSSNRICKIEGLSSLTSLRTLNLSSNLITKVEGLNGLVNLKKLNLSYNQINNVTGLLYLHGTEYKLKHLSLHANLIDSIDHLLQCLLGLQGLRSVTLNQDGEDNPICIAPEYWEIVMESLPQISVLDGLDRLRHPSSLGISSDIPGLDDYVDFLLSSDTSHGEAVRRAVTMPSIDKALTEFRQEIASEKTIDAATGPVTQPVRQNSQPVCPTVTVSPDPVNEERIKKLEHQVSQLIQQAPAGERVGISTYAQTKIRKAKRDTDQTSESECDGKENKKHTRISKFHNTTTTSTTTQESKSTRSDSDHENSKVNMSKSAVGTRRKAAGARAAQSISQTWKRPLRAAKTSGCVTVKSSQEEETYRIIMEERDQEMERRWKAEQAVRKLTEELKCLQTKVSEEKDLQSMALHTTDRLKELLLKERSGRSELQARVEELETRCQSLSRQLEQARSSEEQHRASLQRLEETVSHGDALRARQQAEEVHFLTVYRRALKQLELRLQPGGADFQQAVSKEVAAVEQRHQQREAELQEKLAEGRKLYAALEDEFRMALTIEANRFSEVKEACDHMTAELMEFKTSLAQSQQKEKKSGALVQELTAMVKEQKNRISELIKAKKDAVAELKNRVHYLETEGEQSQRLGLQLEMLKKEKARLVSQLTAQESVIDGLRAERRIWGQELAQQGASLAQDRGRLEARIEVLTAEMETQRKQNDRDHDALRIKAKIVDDQTETIRKLKESLQERDDLIRRLKEEAVQTQKKFQQQLEGETSQQTELKEQLVHLTLRKEELKQQLEDKEAELEDVKRVYSDSNQKWQEKAELLTRLESQVKRMKENFDSKERLLLEEREKASEAHKAAVDKLRCVDDAFRRQLESVQAAHQAELLQLSNEKHKHIEQANLKVYEVEEEMRQLLEETKANKKVMEEKLKRLTNVLKDFNT